jgi:hypothetical protein
MAEQRLRRTEDREMVATIVVERSLIVVDPNQSPDSIADCVLHEVSGLADRQPQAITEGYLLEEAVVAGMTTLLLDTLRRNPDLVAWLQRRGA